MFDDNTLEIDTEFVMQKEKNMAQLSVAYLWVKRSPQLNTFKDPHS